MPIKKRPPTPPDRGDEEIRQPDRTLFAKSPEDILAYFGMSREIIEQGSRKKLPGVKKCAVLVGQYFKKNGKKPSKGDGRVYSKYKKVLRSLDAEGAVA